MRKKEIKLDLNEVFNDEWLNNVYSAAVIAMDYGKNTNKDIEEIAKSVIDYNIEKKLEETILTTLFNNLPKKLNWKEKNLIEAFDEFKEILDICSISNFNKYNFTLILDESEFTKKTINLWQDLAKKDYPELKITILPLKTKNNYKIQIVKIN